MESDTLYGDFMEINAKIVWNMNLSCVLHTLLRITVLLPLLHESLTKSDNYLNS